MDLPRAADVAVIGGGFAGLATAWTLARRGVRDVVVLEREVRLGVHASGKSAGLGRQLAEDDDTTALTVRGAALLRGDGDLGSAWAPTGGTLGFDDDAHLDAYVARAARFGVAVERIDGNSVLARWRSLHGLAVAGALEVASDGTIDVHRLREVLAAGARVETRAAVHAISGERVVTSRGTIAARVVVDATGAWAGQLVGAAPLAAYKRHIFVLGAGAPANAAWFWHLGDRELYVRADGASTLASPCDATLAEPGDSAIAPDARSRLAVRFAEAPALARAEVVREWACQRSFTSDGRMRLGRDPERPWLVWAAGLGGHGATAAAAVGERVAAAVIEALSSS